MEPKWKQMGTQNVPKIEVSKKSAESGLDPLFIIYTHYWHLAKTSLFDTSKQPKCRSFPRGASDAAPGLQNGAHGTEKWPEWGPPGSPRVPKGSPMPPKMLQKIIQNQHPSPGVSPRVPKVPPRSQNTSIFDVPPTGVTPRRGNVRTSPLALCCTPLTASHALCSIPRARRSVRMPTWIYVFY